METLLITGSTGFIGSALCQKLYGDYKIIGIYNTNKPVEGLNITWEQVDLTDFDKVSAVCRKYSPDIIIHCAGIAHQKTGGINRITYFNVNSESTQHLAVSASLSNPYVQFIFCSSVCVYGEANLVLPVPENAAYHPSSDYALSKVSAEKGLIGLFEKKRLRNLIILRLAPVYDRSWSLNLDRRVFAPMKLAYLQFGSGQQEISALARPNLSDFVRFLINRKVSSEFTQQTAGNNLSPSCEIFNVCDTNPYRFKDIIQVFKKSVSRPNRVTLSIPLSLVFLATRISGILFSKKKRWIFSCYDKLASSLVFDNRKMLTTGFQPLYSLYSLFNQ